jgi:hypothetical protein
MSEKLSGFGVTSAAKAHFSADLCGVFVAGRDRVARSTVHKLLSM